jgi:putative membrane protein
MTKHEIAAANFEAHATAADRFSWLRTRLSIERTLMSWVGSATGLIAFGFTIVQVIESVQTHNPEKPVLVPDMARNLGLALIGAGIIGLAFGIAQYRRFIAYMWSDEFKAIAGLAGKPLKRPLIALAILVQVVGIVAFVTVLLRLS